MSSPLAIGLVYETFGSYGVPEGAPADSEVEYEPLATIDALEAAIAGLGHRALRLGTPMDLRRSSEAGELQGIDAALCIAEGRGARNREAWGPVLLEMAGIPALGSDALTLSLSLDKAWTLRHLAACGVPVAPHGSFRSGDEAGRADLPAPFPLFVKPRWEGSAKGIRASSRVASRETLVREVERITRDYQQPALVEAFLPGPEFTVTVIGNRPPRVLPILQRGIEAESGIGIHALEGPGREPTDRLEAITPGILDPDLEAELGDLALRAFEGLECRDFARVDCKLDSKGRAIFLEINPLPTFAPEGSFGILAEIAGRPLGDLLGDVIAGGLRRLGLPERCRSRAGA